jgi:hypothetical protein
MGVWTGAQAVVGAGWAAGVSRHQEVRGAHTHIRAAERVSDCLAAFAHILQMFVKPPLNGFSIATSNSPISAAAQTIKSPFSSCLWRAG